jgi:hypothetical protein
MLQYETNLEDIMLTEITQLQKITVWFYSYEVLK